MAKLKIHGLSIGQRVLLINSLLIIFFVVSTTINIVQLNKSKELVNHSFEVLIPSSEVINDFILMTTRSKMHIINWVYLPNNNRDKARLRELHSSQEYGYPKIIQELSILKKEWKSRRNIAEIDSIVDKFNIIIRYEEDIMALLQSPKDYKDASKIQQASQIIENYIIPDSYELIDRLERLAVVKTKEKQEKGLLINASLDELGKIILATVLFILLGVIIARYFIHSIGKSITTLTVLIQKLSRGEVSDDYQKTLKYRQDELGMMLQAVHRLIKGFRRSSDFAIQIGQGNYDNEYEVLGKNDQVGNALLTMRDDLSRIRLEDKKRDWVNEGLNHFDDILKITQQNTEEFSQILISELVKYLKANQGGVFLVAQKENKQGDEEYMELTACYAWDKLRFLEKKIYLSEGLAGQVWQEGDTLYIDDIPSNYINITSGLGKAKPTHVLIVPLRGNKKIYGIVEIALFEKLEPYQIKFVEKVARNFSLMLSTVRINEHTQILAIENEKIKRDLVKSNKEYKQGQEHINLLEANLKESENNHHNYIKAISDFMGVIELDKKGKIVFINDKYLKFCSYDYQDLLDKNHKVLLKTGHDISKAYFNLWEDLKKGSQAKKTFERKNARGTSFYLEGVYHPIFNKNRKLEKVIGIFNLISESQHQEAEEIRRQNN